MIGSLVDKYSGYSTVLLRVVLGFLIFWHGQMKILNLEGTAGFFGTLGLPIPMVMAIIVAVIETFGGVFLMLGFLTRLSALLNTLLFVVIVFMKIFMMGAGFMGGEGPTYEMDLLYLAGFAALTLTGSAKLSLERILFKKELI